MYLLIFDLSKDFAYCIERFFSGLTISVYLDSINSDSIRLCRGSPMYLSSLCTKLNSLKLDFMFGLFKKIAFLVRNITLGSHSVISTKGPSG